MDGERQLLASCMHMNITLSTVYIQNRKLERSYKTTGGLEVSNEVTS